ncbi:MbcA/ParS/Xre antitoxin family protein [Rhizobium sp. RU36D]|uniref:MbcA/ParS/Xre antitoxin family protein n=1 Tax=Rhizobium sp. RU36D TaxID=1907415 RepID=UPI0009D877E2|nr:MbcA/ParS/Xre antitoxin family protein [Rhizobium sp. RU36D]SMC96550.1 Protein of unknown function [Rhizobium sp. RU36D]
MLQTIQPATTAPSEAATVSKAVIAAADRLGVSARQLAGVLGLSEASISRMKKREFQLERGTKPFELALIFIRLFRSLDAITGGDEAVAQQWLRSPNTALAGVPLDKISSISGITDVLAYLDARRALV